MKNTTLFFLMAAVISTLLIAGCTQQEPVAQPTPLPVTVKTPDTIGTGNSSLGTILVDASGRTLYYFANDVPSSGVSSCSGQCAVIWPVFSTDSIRVSSPLDPADFSSITRADGSKQTTYYGWPLYYYQGDSKPGDVNGENVLKIWFVIQPDESILIAHTTDLGSYLTDTSGKTLYVFTKDTAGTGSCTGVCLAQWPAFGADTITAPSVLKPSDFSSVSRADGIRQTAYMSRPLYYFAGDAKPGDVKGQGFNAAWYVANVSGIVPVATPTTINTLSPTGGGYGGGGY